MVTETKSAQNKRLVLLDSHAIIHRAYHALPDFLSSRGEPTGALYGLTTMILKIVNDLKPDFIVATYDLPKPTHRHEIYKEYKAGRAKTDDELISQLKRSRDLLSALSIPIYDKEGFEADDILGTITDKIKKIQDSRFKNEKIDIIIASGDMDTLQLVDGKKVKVYTLKKGINDTVLYDEDGVRGRFQFGPAQVADYKGLRGDPSDNIPGIKGIGEKTATELLIHFKTVEGIYKALKKDETLLKNVGVKERMIALLRENEEEALFSKMLATIRRDAPVTFTLPPHTWREELEAERVLGLFAELGFRTQSFRRVPGR
jgi:DNA polymerase-1